MKFENKMDGLLPMDLDYYQPAFSECGRKVHPNPFKEF